MSRVILKRYFYPVGQGLCCRERFIFNDEIDKTTGKTKEFNLVYDCGSTFRVNSIPNMRTLIENAFKDVVIDYIFISHFHRDHTNLLDALKKGCKNIKTILIPFINKEEINILLAAADSYVNRKLLNSIEAERYDDIPLKPHSTLDKEENLPNWLSVFWRYKTSNYNYLMHNNLFLNSLSYYKIDITRLQEFDYVNEENIKKDLTKIYSNMGDLNEQSTVLFSFPTIEISNVESIKGFELKSFDKYKDKIGAVFFGDYPLHEYHSDIRTKIVNDHIDINKIGTVQIPHHGSNTGLYPPLYKSNMVYTIPFGVNNRYGHPTKGVVLSITAMEDSLPIYITEHSYYIQKFEFEV